VVCAYIVSKKGKYQKKLKKITTTMGGKKKKQSLEKKILNWKTD